jgi:acyl-CoA synthetase (AMP-forming)/AMP-acid ligase II
MDRNAVTADSLWAQWLAVRRKRPHKVVVVEAASGAEWTADALTDEAIRVAEALRGFRAGERIAFRVPNGAAWLALFLALQKSKLTAIPLDGGLPAEGCHETARRFGASALFLDGQFHSIDKASARKSACCLKLTSGSGALPKAIFCRPAHLLADGRQIISTMKIRPGDVNLGVIPLGHSYGLGNLVMPLILQGTAVVCASEYVPRQLVEWIARHRVTVFPGVPALFRVLASLPAGEGMLDPLHTAISAGAMLPPAVATAFFERFGRKIHNFYGSSETGGICYDRTGEASLAGRSVGTPMDGVTVEVKARRVTVSSAAVATPSGRWRLGDFGEWNPRGELTLLGRATREANIGGKKVHPLEIERVLRALPGVTDACVWLAQKDGRDFVAAAVETALGLAQIRQALAARLPAWKWPKVCGVVAEFPRTARGKVDVAALRQKLTPPDG